MNRTFGWLRSNNRPANVHRFVLVFYPLQHLLPHPREQHERLLDRQPADVHRAKRGHEQFHHRAQVQNPIFIWDCLQGQGRMKIELRWKSLMSICRKKRGFGGSGEATVILEAPGVLDKISRIQEIQATRVRPMECTVYVRRICHIVSYLIIRSRKGQ